ncbi:MAG TPA: glycosyl hydrolase family 18 protein [bacterium]|nr:glycosyl hydrolase family 18 protein [bacterium]
MIAFLILHACGIFNPQESEQMDDGNDKPQSVPPVALLSPVNGSLRQSLSPALHWRSVPNALEYQCQISGESDFTLIMKDTTLADSTYTTSDLERNTTYYWRVRATNSSDHGPWSEVRYFTTLSTKYPPPKSFDQWVTAYFAAWKHFALPTSNWGNVATEAIDWDAFTHMIYFGTGAQADGSLEPVGPYQIFSESRFNSIIPAAHQHGVPILFAVGGWGNYTNFSQAITPEVRDTFIDNLISLMTTWGFDGIDIDMEPIQDSDRDNYTAFINELHARLQTFVTPLLDRPLLTAAVGWQPTLFVELQDKFDQINIMTYDYSGAWQGWVTWHNSPVYNGGYLFPSTGGPLPSANQSIQRYQQAGIPYSKLGIGIDFYGYVWTGVSEPREGWDTPPAVEDNIPYHDIMATFFQPEYTRWDSAAQAAYLSISNENPKQFVSYDNQHSIEAKFTYVRETSLGGLIVWELGGGFRADQPAGERDLLLQTVKNELQME